MKKIVLIAAMAVMSIAASAQEIKFAYVDFNELIMLMPEMDSARATMEENQKTNEEILMSMYQEYQSKVQQYEQKSSTWSPAVLETKQREIMEIEQRLQQTQQSLQPLVFGAVFFRLPDGGLHLRQTLFQRGVFLFQSGDVFIIGLLVVEPGGNGGVGRAEGRGQHAGDIGQGRG